MGDSRETSFYYYWKVTDCLAGCFAKISSTHLLILESFNLFAGVFRIEFFGDLKEIQDIIIVSNRSLHTTIIAKNRHAGGFPFNVFNSLSAVFRLPQFLSSVRGTPL